MATKEKIRKKKEVAKLAEQVDPKDERPGSAQSQTSQVSVKEADMRNVSDNTDEKFKQDENTQEKDENKKDETTQEKHENRKNEENEKEGTPSPSSSKESAKDDKSSAQKSKKQKDEKPDKKSKSQSTPSTQEKKKDVENKSKKKGGKDKKTEKIVQQTEERAPSPAPSLSVPDEQRRTPSPFRKNTVEPTTKQGSSANMGSSASLKSYSSSVKEAWTDKSDVASVTSGTINPNGDSKSQGQKVTGSAVSLKESTKGSAVSVREPTKKRNQVGCVEEKEETWTIKSQEEDSPEQHAYIPYLYARKSIAKIMDDMRAMKTKHIRIVDDIQGQYKAIENETQSQFNIYIITLREHYSTKVKTFRQVIDVHRTDLQQKESYWNEMLASLAERNNRLLKERKTLLIHSKEEIEKLEKEKEELAKEYTQQLDKSTAVFAAGGSVRLEEELKETKEQLEKEQQEVTRLQGLLAAGVVAETTTTKDRKKSVTKETAAKSAVVAAAVVVDKDEKEKMSSERGHMQDERDKISDERVQMEEDRKNFGEERKKWLNEINMLQISVTSHTKESEEWKAKYESMKSQLQDAATVQAKYQALESQYAALASVVATSETTKQAAEENAKKTKDDKNMMENEKQNLEAEITKWEKSFKKKNGREPTQDDKSDSVKEMYVQKEELNVMVTSLDQKLEIYQQLEQGKVPNPPQVAPVPLVIKDPEVKTVEVKVPDPVVLKELAKAQSEIERLQAQILALQQENTEHSSQTSQQNEELSTQRGKIKELEVEIATLKAAAVGASMNTAASEELEKMKKENRELRTDMKKMQKKVEHFEEKETTAMQDPDTRVQSLEEKVTGLDDKVLDLESENEALKDAEQKSSMEKENLMQQISILEQQLSTSGTGSAFTPVTAAIPVRSSAGGEECGIAAHADLAKQLEIKTREVDEREMQIKELNQHIEEKDQELEKLKDEIKDMRKDMIKMAKQQSKLHQKLKELDEFEKTRQLLEAVIFYVHQIHGEIPSAGEAVTQRMVSTDAEVKPFKESKDKAQKSVDSWVEKFKKKHGRDPTNKDRDGEAEKLYKILEDSNKELKDQKIKVEALKIMKTGDYKAEKLERRKSVASLIQPEETAVEKIETQMSALDNKVSDLESENDSLKRDKLDMQSRIRELEAEVKEAKNQAELQASLAVGDQDTEELSNQITSLQKQVDGVEAALIQERAAHDNTKEELENLRKQIDIVKDESANQKMSTEAEMDSLKKNMTAEIKARDEEMDKIKSRNDELEKERLANLPVDTANEIKNLQAKIALLEKEKSTSGTVSTALQSQITELKTKLEASNKNLETQRASNRELEAKVKNNKTDKDKAVRDMASQLEKKEQQRSAEDKKRLGTLERRIKELESSGIKPTAGVAVAAAGKGGPGDKALKEQIAALKRENNELNTRIKQLENEIRRGGGAAGVGSTDDKNEIKRKEKILKELEKKYEIEKKKTERLDENLKTTEDELKVTKKERDNNENELKKVQAELKTLGVAAKEGIEAATKVKTLEVDNKKLGEENKVLTENFNSERVLRKKYYNMVEDMKGKIRVYCRARPLSSSELERKNFSVIKSPDEYSIQVESIRGMKEFQFDQVFMENSTQEKIFEDTHNLIQSAVDGYNVCIFAYGQTGSGKTFTMIGDRDQKFPGIAPRAFDGIFELIHEQRNKFDITVQAYMLELYNEKLIDLFAKPGQSDDEKMEIKKDKRGLVYVQGSVIKDAHNAKELMALFEEGSKNRHTASTKMNLESSRSHLVIGITMESINKTTGQVLKGKLSLVDLAGSERVGKTGATADQLKEAMSINKSLSALGDVISALSSEQQFIPYRNNKLTMLMQDSMGGNAKTLMFVNISPADYNQEESVISLTYASRVKLITNDATKNAENKEVARLKAVIAKMKKGEVVDEEL